MRNLLDLLRIGRTRPVMAAAAGTLALGAGLTIGVLTASGSSQPAGTSDAVAASAQSSSTTVPAASTTPTTAGGAGKTTKKHHDVVRGTITAISGQSWTVQTFRGRTVTVDLSSSTKIGRRLKAAGPVVGTAVVVQFSSVQGTTVTAVRAGLVRHLPSGSSSSSSTTTPTTPATAPSSSPGSASTAG